MKGDHGRDRRFASACTLLRGSGSSALFIFFFIFSSSSWDSGGMQAFLPIISLKPTHWVDLLHILLGLRRHTGIFADFLAKAHTLRCKHSICSTSCCCLVLALVIPRCSDGLARLAAHLAHNRSHHHLLVSELRILRLDKVLHPVT